MTFPFYIARRYLISKKSHNAINIISAISVCGVALATFALVCTLSVFNGFRGMVAGFFTEIDPQLKIMPIKGKVFADNDPRILKVKALPDVAVFTRSLEDNALLQYNGKQAMAIIKGVDDNFEQLTQIDSILYGNGKFMLEDAKCDYAIMGIDLVNQLNAGFKFANSLDVYAPKHDVDIDVTNPATSFSSEKLYSPGVVFVVNQRKYDSQYVITNLAFARRLFDYTNNEVSAVELKLKPNADVNKVKSRIKQIMGSGFNVSDRYEQQSDIFRIMKVEKLISYVFLTFILLIACFNIIGSLSMLIIDKKNDVITLRSLGANDKLIERIFMFEGRMISLAGAIIGVVLGILICYLQQRYGLIKMGGDNSSSFVVDAYPVVVKLGDILLIFVTVVVVGFLSVWYPVHYLSKRLLTK
jgi:lipoprotein-releasing system permease protein